MEIKITEVNGWSKSLEVKKAITRIGSASSADFQLPSNLIAPLHLQILSNPELPTGCRVVNLASQLEVKNNGNTYPLEPYSTQDISDGDEIQLGEYRLTFIVPFSTSVMRTSNSIETTLTLSDTTLQPHLVLDGLLTVKNVGNQDACQFQVALSGLPEDCYHLDPIPLLYPGAQEEVHVRFFHKITYPQAGRRDLLVTVNAPADYPGEELVIRQSIFVAPVFKQAMQLIDDVAASPAQEMPTNENRVSEEPAEIETAESEVQVEEQVPVLSAQIMEAAPENRKIQTQDEIQEVPAAQEVTEPATESREPQPQIEEMETPVAKVVEEPELVIAPLQVEAQEAPAVEVVDDRSPENEQVIEPQVEVPDAQDVEPAKESAQEKPVVSPEPEKSSKPPTPALTVKHDARDEIWSEVETSPQSDQSNAAHNLDLSKVKVVRPHTEKYWDEN